MNEPQTLFYDFDSFRIDVGKRLLLKSDGQPVPLTPKAFDTLLYLVQHSGRLLDKNELLRAVWPDATVEENNLNQHISTLRRVLGDRRDEHRYIVTAPGRGYRFASEVKIVGALRSYAPSSALEPEPSRCCPSSPSRQIIGTRSWNLGWPTR